MNKQEFLTALWKQLSDMPKEDVQSSLDYYCEMIDDRVEAGMSEEDAVKEIGSVEEAVKQITSDSKNRSTAGGSENNWGKLDTADMQSSAASSGTGNTGTGNTGADSAGYVSYDSYISNKNAERDKAGTSYQAQAAGSQTTGSTAATSSGGSSMSGGKIALLIIGFPIWFPLVIVVFSLLFAAFVTIWALAFSFSVAAVSLIVAGIAGVFSMIVNAIAGEIAVGLVNLGIGFFAAGLGLLLLMSVGPLFRATARGSRAIWRAVTGIFRRKENA